MFATFEKYCEFSKCIPGSTGLRECTLMVQNPFCGLNGEMLNGCSRRTEELKKRKLKCLVDGKPCDPENLECRQRKDMVSYPPKNRECNCIALEEIKHGS